MTALVAQLGERLDPREFLETALKRQWPIWAFILFLVTIRQFAPAGTTQDAAGAADTVFWRVVIFVLLTTPVLLVTQLAACGSIKAMGARFIRRITSPQDVLNVAACLTAVSLSIYTFPSFKVLIPVVNPFAWDEAFTLIDRALHFGVDPWVWTEMLLGYGAITVAIDKIYYLWFVVVFVAVTYAAMMPATSVLRNQVLYAHFGAWWLLGIVMGTALSSVGPIFHPQLTGEATFAPLVAALEGVRPGLNTIEVRDTLWARYMGTEANQVAGISAMPSLHNALCVWLLLAAWQLGRVWTWLAAIFCGVIFVGSVHLGWHYAIDAYVAAIAMIAVWKGSGWLARRTTPDAA